MIPRGLPFQWGSPAVAIPVPPPIPPFWTRETVSRLDWQGDPISLMPRFEHIFPEADTGPQFQRVNDAFGD